MDFDDILGAVGVAVFCVGAIAGAIIVVHDPGMYFPWMAAHPLTTASIVMWLGVVFVAMSKICYEMGWY